MSGPGDGLLHPVPLVAMVALGVNDHWGKVVYPGIVTGKVSDFAGMVFFPILLDAMAEWALHLSGRAWAPTVRRGRAMVLATGIVFALVKTWGPMGLVYRYGLAVLQSPVTGGVYPVTLHQDPTDLVALVALVYPWIYLGRRAGRQAR